MQNTLQAEVALNAALARVRDEKSGYERTMHRIGEVIRAKKLYSSATLPLLGCVWMDSNAVRAIAKLVQDNGLMLSVGAGVGAWDAMVVLCLISRGISVADANALVASSDPMCGPFWQGPPQANWREVIGFDADTHLRKSPDAAVLKIEYPCYEALWPAEALKLFEGRYIVYVGEPMGNANATDEFFYLLGQAQSEDVVPLFKILEEHALPQIDDKRSAAQTALYICGRLK